MKRSTALRHLREMAEVASDLTERLRGSSIEWPLVELWAAGDIVGGEAELEECRVVLVLDLEDENGELPWLELHPSGDWVREQLRLGKRPVGWVHVTAGRPVFGWNLEPVVRYWSAGAGADDAVVEALAQGRTGELHVVRPGPDDLRAELARSRDHLRSVLDRFWEPDWRREHKGFGIYPEEHLWRAAEAVAELEAALDRTR
jgi:hypothetical protein